MYGQNNPYAQYPYTGYAYPNYGRQNFMQPQQQMAQPQMQQQPQVQQPTLPTLCYAKMEEAKPFIITAPNSSMLFIDREKGKALLKTTDNVCNSYSRHFNIEETDENGNALKPQEPNPQVDYSQFVTKKEIGELPTAEQYKQLAEQYNTLLAKFETMQKIIAGGKPNGNGTNTAKGN